MTHVFFALDQFCGFCALQICVSNVCRGYGYEHHSNPHLDLRARPIRLKTYPFHFLDLFSFR